MARLRPSHSSVNGPGSEARFALGTISSKTSQTSSTWRRRWDCYPVPSQQDECPHSSLDHPCPHPGRSTHTTDTAKHDARLRRDTQQPIGCTAARSDNPRTRASMAIVVLCIVVIWLHWGCSRAQLQFVVWIVFVIRRAQQPSMATPRTPDSRMIPQASIVPQCPRHPELEPSVPARSHFPRSAYRLERVQRHGRSTHSRQSLRERLYFATRITPGLQRLGRDEVSLLLPLA